VRGLSAPRVHDVLSGGSGAAEKARMLAPTVVLKMWASPGVQEAKRCSGRPLVVGRHVVGRERQVPRVDAGEPGMQRRCQGGLAAPAGRPTTGRALHAQERSRPSREPRWRPAPMRIPAACGYWAGRGGGQGDAGSGHRLPGGRHGRREGRCSCAQVRSSGAVERAGTCAAAPGRPTREGRAPRSSTPGRRRIVRCR